MALGLMKGFIMKAGGENLKRLFCKRPGRIRKNPHRHAGMGSIFSQLLAVPGSQNISILISLTVDMEFFCLPENIIYIGKRDGFLIEYFLISAVIDQSAIINNSVALLLDRSQLINIRACGRKGTPCRNHGDISLA